MALPLLRSRHTWRNTCAGLHETLAGWQPPRDVRGALRARRREAEERAEAAADLYAAREDATPDEPAVSLRPPAACRPAAPPPRMAAPAPSPSPAPLVLRPLRRLREGRRKLIELRRTQGRRAAVTAAGRAVIRRVARRLRRLLRFLGPGRGGP